MADTQLIGPTHREKILEMIDTGRRKSAERVRQFHHNQLKDFLGRDFFRACSALGLSWRDVLSFTNDELTETDKILSNYRPPRKKNEKWFWLRWMREEISDDIRNYRISRKKLIKILGETAVLEALREYATEYLEKERRQKKNEKARIASLDAKAVEPSSPQPTPAFKSNSVDPPVGGPTADENTEEPTSVNRQIASSFLERIELL